jgi:hypothetical protein
MPTTDLYMDGYAAGLMRARYLLRQSTYNGDPVDAVLDQLAREVLQAQGR